MKIKLVLLSVLTVALCGQGRPVAPSQIQSVSGNGPSLVTTSGAQVSGDIVQIDVNGNHVDSGVPCCASGGGVLQVQNVTIHQPAVLTLATTPVTLLPAPGAGIVLFPQSIVIQIKGSATYDNGGGPLNFHIGTEDLLDWAILFSSGKTIFLGSANLSSSVYHDDSTLYTNQPMTVQSSSPVTGAGGDVVFTIYYTTLVLP